MKNARYFVMIAVLLLAAVYLRAHRVQEIIPQAKPLTEFPLKIGNWNGHDQVIDQETLDVLGAGSFLSRGYLNDKQIPPVDLFIAYFPSQRQGDAIHSPKNCLPGSGWTFLESDTMPLEAPGHAPMKIGRYVIGKGTARELVLYWYEAHGRSVASEYSAKIYMVTDSVRLNRTDGALVRVITPILPSESEASAQNRLLDFTKGVVAQLNQYIPR